ncbi:DUF4181 domain-containing protein [Neobacillus sp. PS3-34]|uniref:DUF4181 domain-containing protein n=1 Tax=Neobacillus sp. PS3-34 TaxID=3070678 RepID=UPI0027E1A1D8|nr:DUF4181 domain-containing protein [Neobacillus sp. PS3-34]WML48551.1 DUF4181 domain-containing protein [Neobacillus sp. PS3-34]
MIVGPEREELTEDGKGVDLWGKVILSALGIITFIFINIENEAMKWFWILFVIAAFGFQSFVDWKYLKESKRYIVSLIVLIFGVTLVYFLV